MSWVWKPPVQLPCTTTWTRPSQRVAPRWCVGSILSKYLFFPSCTESVWLFMCCFAIKLKSQMLHLKCFIFSWTNATCVFKLPFSVKLASQALHLRGFFPSWTNIETFSLQLWTSNHSIRRFCKYCCQAWGVWTVCSRFKNASKINYKFPELYKKLFPIQHKVA